MPDDRAVVKGPHAYRGVGFVLDSSHPLRPGDARRFPITVTISSDPAREQFAIAVADSGDTTSPPDQCFMRQGRIFCVDTTGAEAFARPLGDLTAATLAMVHPELVHAAEQEAGENVAAGTGGIELLAANGVLWSMDVIPGGRPNVSRRYHNERLGDGIEVVRFASDGYGLAGPAVRTSVKRNGIEVANLAFDRAAPAPSPRVPAGNRDRDRHHVLAPEDIHFHALVPGPELAPRQVNFKEVVPHLFTIDLDTLNTRVTIAEFTDSLIVIEGAYSSRNCDLLADAVRAHFHKPVRMFAFSHLHGQYSGGTRSWVHEGATIVVPPSTEALIRQMVAAPFKLRPDALEQDPKPLRILTVPRHLHVEDSMNALDIYNVESGHTDEYFLFHFPRQKVLLTGDLMFLRPGKPFSGRSKQLCATVAKLDLDVDTYVATWPLSGYGTKSIVTRDEFQAACEAAK